ncbi:MAG: hypothetical protein KatS3mg111_0287 [Pirellulaceae bacterium]|nr:MAG: hypothetical protein KatS3mg111_0287 [Pirellulaceae bacterium]
MRMQGLLTRAFLAGAVSQWFCSALSLSLSLSCCSFRRLAQSCGGVSGGSRPRLALFIVTGSPRSRPIRMVWRPQVVRLCQWKHQELFLLFTRRCGFANLPH